MGQMVDYVTEKGWEGLIWWTLFGKKFVNGQTPVTGSAVKYHVVEFYAWLGQTAQDHGSRLAYKMKEDEANRLIRQLVG